MPRRGPSVSSRLAEAKRYPDLPDVPTIDETLPGVVTSTWVGFLRRRERRAAIIDKLNKAMTLALEQPDTIAKFKVQGLTPIGSSPDELRTIAKEEIERWGKILPAISAQTK